MSRMPAWWPPKVGDKLRSVDDTFIPTPNHVTAVFTHEGMTCVVVAWYGKHRQYWHYNVVTPSGFLYDAYWPDGEDHPDPVWRARIEKAKERL